MAFTPATARQIPDHAILDVFNKQVYLGNQFNYVLSTATGGTSEVAALSFANPVINTVALFLNLRRATGITAAATMIMRTYLSPTISSPGTPVTPTQLRPANANVSVADLRSAPTASSNGTLVEALGGLALTSFSANTLFVIDPGKTLLVTLQTSATATVLTEIDWYEQ